MYTPHNGSKLIMVVFVQAVQNFTPPLWCSRSQQFKEAGTCNIGKIINLLLVMIVNILRCTKFKTTSSPSLKILLFSTPPYLDTLKKLRAAQIKIFKSDMKLEIPFTTEMNTLENNI